MAGKIRRLEEEEGIKFVCPELQILSPLQCTVENQGEIIQRTDFHVFYLRLSKLDYALG